MVPGLMRERRYSPLQMLLLFFAVLLLAGSHSFAQVVAGYYPAWAGWSMPPNAIQYDKLTHVIHCFVWPDRRGRLQMYDEMRSSELTAAAHAQNTKVLIAVGGWGNSDNFPRVTAREDLRRRFIEEIIGYVEEHNYDGIDIDWEYPESDEDKKNLTIFIKELNKALKASSNDMLLTIAVPPTHYRGQWYDYFAIEPYLDWFGIMTYDYFGWNSVAGHNSPLFDDPLKPCDPAAIANDFYYLNITRGIPTHKLVLGIPFYGQQFSGVEALCDTGKTETAMHYKDILAAKERGWEYNWDSVAMSPFLVEPAGSIITYDDPASVRVKTEYAKDLRLAGVMIWSIDQDIAAGDNQLLAAVREGLANTYDLLPDPVPCYNYPNPFTTTTAIHFTIHEQAFVNLKVFDAAGQHITTLVNEIRDPGSYRVPFHAEDLPPGIYFYRLDSINFTETGKCVLLASAEEK